MRGLAAVQRRRGRHPLILRRFGRCVLPSIARTIVGPSLTGCGGFLGLNCRGLKTHAPRQERMVQRGGCGHSSRCLSPSRSALGPRRHDLRRAFYISIAVTWKKGGRDPPPAWRSSRQASILALIIFPASAVSMISPFFGAWPLSSEQRSRDPSWQVMLISHVAISATWRRGGRVSRQLRSAV